MAYLIIETYLGDLKPRQMFNQYLAKDAERTDVDQFIPNINYMKVCDTHDEAFEYATNVVRDGRTWDVVEKDDNYLAKLYLGTEGYGV